MDGLMESRRSLSVIEREVDFVRNMKFVECRSINFSHKTGRYYFS